MKKKERSKSFSSFNNIIRVTQENEFNFVDDIKKKLHFLNSDLHAVA